MISATSPTSMSPAARPRIAIPIPTSTDPEYNGRAWQQYGKAIERAGGIAVPVPLDEPQEALAKIAASCAGVLLPGSGADIDPEKYGERPIAACNKKDAAREAADELLLQDAFNLQKPILGICYGLQALNIWRNGTLIQDLPGAFAANGQGQDQDQDQDQGQGQGNILADHAAGRKVLYAHPVTLSPGSRLAAILDDASDVEHTTDFSRISVNSSHHQAVGRVGDQLRMVARSPADGVIEAVEGELRDQFVLGVQWHPERSYEESSASRALFAAFVQAAAEWRPRPIHVSVAK